MSGQGHWNLATESNKAERLNISVLGAEHVRPESLESS
jgi:hypothetical protein